MSSQYNNGDLLEVKIEKIVPNGPGLAFAEDLTIFVPLAAAGDKLRVRIEEIKGKTAFAEIEELVEPSPDRTTAPCEYYGSCGGCNFQHLAYETQINAKIGIIRDCFKRIAKISDQFEFAVVPSPESFGYRLRALWHVDTRNKKIGFYRRNSRELVDIERCMILAPELQQKLDFYRNNLPWQEFWGEKAQIEAACGDGSEVSVFSDILPNRPTKSRFLR
ncbi:MAG: class I SAM-dependent RNA methyltransferase [Blastocatellia bacterium]